MCFEPQTHSPYPILTQLSYPTNRLKDKCLGPPSYLPNWSWKGHPHAHSQTCAHTGVCLLLCGPLHHQLIFPVENPTQIHNQTSLISIMFPLRQRSKQSDLTKEIKKAPAGIATENQTHQTQALSFVFFLMSFKLGPSPLGHLANTRLPEVPFLPPLLPTGSSAGL